MTKWCYNYDSGEYEYIDKDGFSIDRGEYVYNWDDSEYRREREEEEEEERRRREDEDDEWYFKWVWYKAKAMHHTRFV